MPRVRRTIEETIPDEQIDMVDAAIDAAEDEKTPFDEIRNLFVNLQETEGSSPLGITLMVRQNPNSNQWSFIKTDHPDLETFDPDKAISDVLNEYGPGSYKFVVRIGRRIRKHVEFNVGDPRKKNDPIPVVNNDSKELMPVLFSMMQEQSKAALDAQKESSERFMLMMQQMNNSEKNTMTTLLPLLMQNKGPDLVTIIGALAPLAPIVIKMFERKDQMKELIETITAVQNLTGGGMGGGEGEGMLGIAKTFAGPLMSALAAQQEQAKLAQMTAPQQRQALPAPMQQQQPMAQSQEAVSVDDNLHPILALIKDDILYYASKNKDPVIVAESLAAELELQGLGYNDFVPLAQELMVSGDWLTELAKRGIDLRAHNAWAHSVLQELSNILAANSEHGQAQAGNGGNTTDAFDNVETGEAREPIAAS